MEHLVTVQKAYEDLDAFYPFSTQMSFDNAGFLVGDGTAPVTKILVALDITSRVIAEAVYKRCELIVTHHPIIFNPLKSVVAQNPNENLVIQLIQRNIAVISAHTNLDRSMEGVNFHLAKQVGIQNPEFLLKEGTDPKGWPIGSGMMGHVHASGVSAKEYAKFVETQLGCKGIRLSDCGGAVSKVAVGGGSCGSLLSEVAKQGCDTFITGDVKYDVFLEARERGINLIDAGHFPTEQVICKPMSEKLQGHYLNIQVLCAETHFEVSTGI